MVSTDKLSYSSQGVIANHHETDLSFFLAVAPTMVYRLLLEPTVKQETILRILMTLCFES